MDMYIFFNMLSLIINNLIHFLKEAEHVWTGYTVAIFYFSSEVEQFLYDYSIGSLCSAQGSY